MTAIAPCRVIALLFGHVMVTHSRTARRTEVIGAVRRHVFHPDIGRLGDVAVGREERQEREVEVDSRGTPRARSRFATDGRAGRGNSTTVTDTSCCVLADQALAEGDKSAQREVPTAAWRATSRAAAAPVWSSQKKTEYWMMPKTKSRNRGTTRANSTAAAPSARRGPRSRGEPAPVGRGAAAGHAPCHCRASTTPILVDFILRVGGLPGGGLRPIGCQL